MKKELKQLGFSEKEIEVYLAGLRLGPASVYDISKEAKIKRTTAYLILERLKERGLVSLVIIKKKHLFKMAEPEKLLKLLEEEREKLQEKEKIIKEVLPEIKAISKKIVTPSKIRYFEGKEGIWDIFEDILAERNDFYFFGSGKTLFELVTPQKFIERFTKKRRQIGKTKAYIITDHHPELDKMEQQGDIDFREFKFLAEKIKLPSLIILYGNKLALMSLKEKITGIIIENNEIVEVMRYLFNFIWQRIKK